MKSLLLKLSGEALGGSGNKGFARDQLERLSGEIAEAWHEDLLLGIVVGGGNFIRGKTLSELGISGQRGDYMGMTATVLNALALEAFLEKKNVPVSILSAIAMPQVVPEFSFNRLNTLQNGVVLFPGGTGNSAFTTDTAAALRAVQINAEVVLKATQVDGVFSADPKLDSSATMFQQLTFDEVLERRLNVMDLTAITLCREHDISIRVFNLHKPGNLYQALQGEAIGTTVGSIS